MPPFAKNATKMRHFQAKISKIFSGGEGAGIAPSPDPTPTGRGIPLIRPLTSRRLRRFTSTPCNFFPISIITLDYGALIDALRKSNRRLVLLVDLGLLNGTRLEVGPVNIQSSH